MKTFLIIVIIALVGFIAFSYLRSPEPADNTPAGAAEDQGFMESLFGSFGINISVNQGEDGNAVDLQIGGDAAGNGALINTKVRDGANGQKVDLQMGGSSNGQNSMMDIQVEN